MLDYCVIREGGLGGFVTYGVQRLINYSMHPASVSTNPFRKFFSSAYKKREKAVDKQQYV